jgi:predicted nucleic acid-binding protein
VSAVIVLDSSPIGLLAHTRPTPQPLACRTWLAGLVAAGRRVILPEIADYEVRRELLRLRRGRAIARLNYLVRQLEYLPLTTAAMHKAAELWAAARQGGQPTAGDKTIDADMILAGQALTLGVPNVIVATTNVGHLARVVPANAWQNIAP